MRVVSRRLRSQCYTAHVHIRLCFLLVVILINHDSVVFASTSPSCEAAKSLPGTAAPDETVRVWRACLQESPDDRAAMHNLGVAYLEGGQYNAATELFTKVLQVAPTTQITLRALARAHEKAGRISQAAQTYARAAELALPQDATLAQHAIMMLLQSGDDRAALSLNTMSLGAVPADAGLWLALAQLLSVAGPEQSTGFHRSLMAVTRLEPGNADAHFGLGMHHEQVSLHVAGPASHTAPDPRPAALHFANAARASQAYTAAGLSSAYGLYREVCSWGQSESLRDLSESVLSKCWGEGDDLSLLSSANNDNHLEGHLRQFVQRLDCARVRRPHPLPRSHQLLSMDLNPRVVRNIASDLSLASAKGSYTCRWIGHSEHTDQKHENGHKRLVLGYASSDFINHATAHLLKGAFALHDSDRVRLLGLALGHGNDDDDGSSTRSNGASRTTGKPWRESIAEAMPLHTIDDTSSASDGASTIRALGVDVLVNLNGWTAGARNDIFAERAAPIQALYLGYPGTMGGCCMDYIITDAVVSPVEYVQDYSEKLCFLPGSFYVNDHARYHAQEARLISTDDDRLRHRLPRHGQGLVFACFNQFYKIDSTVFSTWMDALRLHKRSVLWLIEWSTQGARTLRRRAQAKGIDPRRLVFAPRADIVEFVARSVHADVFVDTHAVGAHTVAMDISWMGLPMVVAPGRQYASRVAASVLMAALDGSPGSINNVAGATIARNAQDYASLIQRVTQREIDSTKRDDGHPRSSWLVQQRRKLLQARPVYEGNVRDKARMVNTADTGSLFDSGQKVKQIESATRMMYEVHVQGLSAMHIVVARRRR